MVYAQHPLLPPTGQSAALIAEECFLRAPPDLRSYVKGRYLRPQLPVRGPRCPGLLTRNITARILAYSAVPGMSGSLPRWPLVFRGVPGTVPGRAIAARRLAIMHRIRA
jgi:hypothetical protein